MNGSRCCVMKLFSHQDGRRMRDDEVRRHAVSGGVRSFSKDPLVLILSSLYLHTLASQSLRPDKLHDCGCLCAARSQAASV